MTQEALPEIQTATDALERRIAITETEIVQMKETMVGKKSLVRALRKAASAMNPKTRIPNAQAPNRSLGCRHDFPRCYRCVLGLRRGFGPLCFWPKAWCS